MNIKKLATVSALIGALLIGSFAIGHAMGESSSEETLKKQFTKLQNENEEIKVQLKETGSKMQAPATISETYQITFMSPDEYRGEKANEIEVGTGVKYDELKIQKHVKDGSVKVGDYIVITWPYDAWVDNDWDEIEKVVVLGPVNTAEVLAR